MVRSRARLALIAGGSAAVVAFSMMGVPAFADDGVSSPSPAPTDSATPSPSPTPTPTATAPVPVPMPKLAARIIRGEASSARTVVLRGTALGDVASIAIRGVEVGPVRHLSSSRISVRIGTASRFAPATTPLVLRRSSNGRSVTTAVRMRFVVTTFRSRELQWAWSDLTRRSYTWGHPYIYKYDCANFASHALVAAGMPSSVLDVSSTSLRTRLLARGAEELADTQRNRARVRVGDLIQFDWHPSARVPGDRDHTGIVTGVDRDGTGRIVVRYSAHTDGGNNPSQQLVVERTMNRPHHDPHGKVYFLHLPV